MKIRGGGGGYQLHHRSRSQIQIAVRHKNRSSAFVALVRQSRSTPIYYFAETRACAVSAGIPPAGRLQ